jgi:plastocyanin
VPRSKRSGAVGFLVWTLLITASRPVMAGDITITQKGRSFSLAEVTVHVGDTLVFVNADPFKHNVYSPSDGFAFDLDVQPPGHSDRVAVTRRGSFDVLCHIHPKMKLRVKVE